MNEGKSFIKQSKINNTVKIGPEYVRVKTDSHKRQKGKEVIVEGIVCHVGIDFVDILLDDDHTVTLLTEYIKQVEWNDKHVRNVNKCKHSGDCRCIIFESLKDRHNNKRNNKTCFTCNNSPCNCNINKNSRKMEHKNRERESKEKNNCPECHSKINCHPKYTCYCDYPIPFCDDRIELRLAGLTHNVNFELLQKKGYHGKFLLEGYNLCC
ncbi:hypothetical protein [Sutcliffiella cohnii]|uniref:hypothetical protein n=1 Tax=Sutcliffiella cohnii TaxID=33932 RepID=UPI002E202603|nr:hypothetical protein [Sutcliffiella cohnii]